MEARPASMLFTLAYACQPVAILKPLANELRTMSEIIAEMEAGGTSGFVDEDFARDIERGIENRSEPWNPPAWD